MLRPTPGDPWGVEQHHWNTGAEENQQLNPSGPSNNFRVPDARTYLLQASSGALSPKLLNYIHFREETYMLFKKKKDVSIFFLLNSGHGDATK